MLVSIFSLEKNAVITFIASVLIWIMVFGVFYFWVFQKRINFRHVMVAFSAMFLAWSVSELLKQIFPTQRPFMVSGLPPLTLTWPFDSSFPSAHTSSAFALAVGLRKSDKRLFILYFIFAVIVAFGRVLSRVHYFLDVFVGAMIGVLAVAILEKLGMERFLKKILA